MMRALFIASCLTLVLTPKCVAAEPSTGAAAHFEAVAAARDLLVAAGFETQMEQTALGVGNMTFNEAVAAFQKNGTDLPPSLLARVRTILNEEVGGLVSDLKKTALNDAADVYANYFTAEEIRRLAVINQDPVMKKAQSIMPQMMTQLSQIGVKTAAARQPRMQQKLKAAIDQWVNDQQGKAKSS